MTDEQLSPRARAILAAVEREIEERRRGAPVAPVRPLRIDAELLSALELAVAGLSREEVRTRLAVRDHVLDAVYGDGSPGSARLSRGTKNG
jgi:hypothetical protein